MTVVVRQRPCGSLEDIGVQLREAFESIRSTIASDEPTVLVVRSRDLLGQGTLEDAAVATGLLGLMRAVVFEGRSKGWRVNVVAVGDGDDPPDILVAALSEAGVTGQVLNLSVDSVGKVVA